MRRSTETGPKRKLEVKNLSDMIFADKDINGNQSEEQKQKDDNRSKRPRNAQKIKSEYIVKRPKSSLN